MVPGFRGFMVSLHHCHGPVFRKIIVTQARERRLLISWEAETDRRRVQRQNRPFKGASPTVYFL